MRQGISTDKAPIPAGYYSQAVRAGDVVYVSGQVPRAADGSYTPADVARETRLTLDNLAAIAHAAGGELDDIVKITAYLTCAEYFAAFDATYAAYFQDPPPARTTVIAGLREVKVELDAVLYLPL